MLMVNHLIGFGAAEDGPSLTGNSQTFTLGTNSAGVGTRTTRVVLAAALFAAGNGTAVRLSLVASSGGATITKVYFGQQAAAGDSYDAASLTQITFDGGNASTGAIAGGATKVSDIVPFVLDSSKAHVVSYYVSSGDVQYKSGSTANVSVYYSGTSTDQAATTDVTGYTNDATNQPYGLLKVEW